MGDGVTNYVPDFGEIGDYLDALDIDLSVLIYAITTGDIDELEEALKRVDRGLCTYKRRLKQWSGYFLSFLIRKLENIC